MLQKYYIKAFISNYHVIQESPEIVIEIPHEKYSKKINLEDKFKYSNPEDDITIIGLKEEDDKIEYMNLDDNVLNGNNLSYIGKSIYII